RRSPRTSSRNARCQRPSSIPRAFTCKWRADSQGRKARGALAVIRHGSPPPLSHNPAAMQPELGEAGIAESGLQRFDDAIAHEDAALDARAHPEIGPDQGRGGNRDVAVLNIADMPTGPARLMVDGGFSDIGARVRKETVLHGPEVDDVERARQRRLLVRL